MEWLRRIFGYSERFGSEHKPYKSPTWEEIFDQHNSGNRSHAPNDPFKDFHMDGDTYSFDMGGYEDSFSSVFGQMDDMFRQLDSIMQNFHGYQGNVFITEGPDVSDPSESQSPRDMYLKKSESEPKTGVSPKLHNPSHPFVFSDPSVTEPRQGKDDFDTGHDDMDRLFEFDMRDPFGMVEDFMKSFGGAFRMSPFGENRGGVPMLPGPEGDGNHRDTLLKKKDTDLDDRITGDFSSLLKDMPKYDPPAIPGQHGVISPSDGIQTQPRIQQRYHSTSIVRIRRPDGSVEETRKYRDSTGREEVTVTHTEPQEGESGSLLHPGDHEMNSPDLQSHHFIPSIFSWVFTR